MQALIADLGITLPKLGSNVRERAGGAHRTSSGRGLGRNPTPPRPGYATNVTRQQEPRKDPFAYPRERECRGPLTDRSRLASRQYQGYRRSARLRLSIRT